MIKRAFGHRFTNLTRAVGIALTVGIVMIGWPVRPSVAATELSRTPITIFGLGACPNAGTCSVDFGVVPGNARRRYEITHVSCYLSIGNTNGKVLYWYLHATRDGQIIGRIHLRPHLLGTVPNSVVTYNANEDGLVVVPGGGTLLVTMSRDASSIGGIPSIDCTISGYDVRLQ